MHLPPKKNQDTSFKTQHFEGGVGVSMEPTEQIESGRDAAVGVLYDSWASDKGIG